MSIWSKSQLPSTSKPNKEYRDVTEWLFQQFPSYQVIGSKAYKPTLDNINKLLSIFGNPQEELCFIHVAGSNGKGSVCSMLSSILTSSGKKVGLFTSPHIVDFTERIRINGECIDQDSVVEFVKKIKTTSLDFSPSFFEITFAMAITHFDREKVDVCVIETGLGGRLDATNIITPICSAITSISLEHTAILGNTIEDIAREKGGIIKPQVPVVFGNLVPNALNVLAEIAELNKSEYKLFSRHNHSFSLPFIAAYQNDNFEIVLDILSFIANQFYVTSAQIQEGLDNIYNNTGFIGRLQIVHTEPLIILDVSHNPDGIRKSVLAILELNYENLHIIYGTSSDKDAEEIVRLFPPEASLQFTTFSNPRSKSLRELNELAEKIPRNVFVYDNALNAYNETLNKASSRDIIWITGSFFLAADFF